MFYSYRSKDRSSDFMSITYNILGLNCTSVSVSRMTILLHVFPFSVKHAPSFPTVSALAAICSLEQLIFFGFIWVKPEKPQLNCGGLWNVVLRRYSRVNHDCVTSIRNRVWTLTFISDDTKAWLVWFYDSHWSQSERERWITTKTLFTTWGKSSV